MEPRIRRWLQAWRCAVQGGLVLLSEGSYLGLHS